MARPQHPSSLIFPHFALESLLQKEDLEDWTTISRRIDDSFLFDRALARAESRNFGKAKIMLDPGIGLA